MRTSFTFGFLCVAAVVEWRCSAIRSDDLESETAHEAHANSTDWKKVGDWLIEPVEGRQLSDHGCLCRSPCVGNQCVVMGGCPGLTSWSMSDSCGNAEAVRDHVDVSLTCNCGGGGQSGYHRRSTTRVLGKLSSMVNQDLSQKRATDECAIMCCNTAGGMEFPYTGIWSYGITYDISIRYEPVVGDKAMYHFDGQDLVERGIVRKRDVPSEGDDQKSAVTVQMIDTYRDAQLYKYYAIHGCKPGKQPRLDYEPVKAAAWDLAKGTGGLIKGMFEGALMTIPGVGPGGGGRRHGSVGGGGIDGWQAMQFMMS